MAQVFSFPLDLERHIFETVAALEPAMIPSLLRVCRRIHSWLEPLLFRVVVLDKGHKMLSAVKSRSPEVLRAGVRHLFLDEAGGGCESWPGLFSHCEKLSQVELWLGPEGVTPYLPALSNLRLQSLALMLLPHHQFPLTQRLFLSVTHLDILLTSDVPGVWADWAHLAALPALTHLCLGKDILGPILPLLVVQCPRLIVICTALGSAA
ncbi:hypothetical protein B0H10DRAFT_2213743 [Mycena sp. CBHHK59/15]|nr:hypothetical protein B0H10DRAFT_2213743 [Mycena sp. CBHHK59/15]